MAGLTRQQGRRPPPAVPALEGKSSMEMGRQLIVLWRWIVDSFTGLAAKHAFTHLPVSGSDPLTIGTPVGIAITNAKGNTDDFADAGHIHASGLTTKGDLLTVSTVLTRLPVGTDGKALVADSTQATGLKWDVPVGANHNLLSATHPDTTPGSPVRGDLIVANSTPLWTKFAIGSTDKVLMSNGTDPSWASLDLASNILANQVFGA
jgi:hypothetical protein